MNDIPRPALFLGLVGLIPFLYGALTHLAPAAAVTPLHGAALLTLYGVIILCFMGGVLWGFAAKAGLGLLHYAASTAPALIALVPALFWPDIYEGPGGLLVLFNGFVVLILLDNWFATAGWATGWWMRLRVLLTAVVWLCLAIGGLA
ncbi:MAG: DUF3429 domain-containing protein [Pseudomonadota bacterium]